MGQGQDLVCTRRRGDRERGSHPITLQKLRKNQSPPGFNIDKHRLRHISLSELYPCTPRRTILRYPPTTLPDPLLRPKMKSETDPWTSTLLINSSSFFCNVLTLDIYLFMLNIFEYFLVSVTERKSHY